MSRSSGVPEPCSSSVAEAAPAKLNGWVRRTHRWVSLAFTVAVVANIVFMGREEPVVRVGLLALLPLALLLFTGLYLFALPYAGRRRNGRRAV